MAGIAASRAKVSSTRRPRAEGSAFKARRISSSAALSVMAANKSGVTLTSGKTRMRASRSAPA